METNAELSAQRLVGDSPTWVHLQRLGSSPNLVVRQAAIDAAGRAVDAPASVLQVMAEVALLATGRASSWTPRFHRLRPSGHATRFVADVLQQAGLTPVPVLIDLMQRPETRWVAAECVSHQSPSVRAVARAIVTAAAVADGDPPPRHADDEPLAPAAVPVAARMVW